MTTSCECIRYMEVEPPVWVLDRRDSGHLFWRRSHSLVDKRVKFRCDVEVLEFFRSDEEKQEMLGGGIINPSRVTTKQDDDLICQNNNNSITSLLEYRGNSCRVYEEMAPPSSMAAAFCICVILATLSYNWLVASSF